MPLCKCPHCLEEVPGGKSVSKSTFHHHIKKFSHKNTHFKICRCSRHPTGHHFRSRSSYYQHHQSQSSQRENISDNTDCDNSSTTSSLLSSTSDFNPISDFNNYRNNIGQLIENNLNHDDDDIIHQELDDFDSSLSDQSLDIDRSGMFPFE